MKRLLVTFLSIACWAVAAAPAQSALIPRPGSGDPRVHVVDFDPTEVVVLQGTLGYQTLIEFAADERIENVAVGDALGWQITPNRKANLLFVKPMDKVPVTNMTVVTNLRHYNFELNVQAYTSQNNVVYTLRFLYPESAVAVVTPPEPEAPPPPQVINSSYSYEGSTKVLPSRIFDDGQATYFQFGEHEAYPAVFSMDANGDEAVVNSHIRNGYVVVDMIARGFVLRQGSDVTKIYNDGFQDAAPDPQSPQPRKSSCWICL